MKRLNKEWNPNMNRIFNFSVFLFVMFLFFPLICISKPTANDKNGNKVQDLKSDQELSKMQVGKWLCDDPTGKSKFVFKPDGTWSEEGLYYFDDGNRKISFSGRWYIKDGCLYQTLDRSNIPEKVAPYDWIWFKIVAINENENIVVFSSGELHRHQRIK